MFFILLFKSVFAAQGTVVVKNGGCDYFIVSTPKGYDLLEWYGGHDPDKDDVVVGDFERYGFHDIHDITADEGLRVWVEDYDLTSGDAMEKYGEECQ